MCRPQRHYPQESHVIVRIGWKMHRRMQGLEEFAFEQILNDADLPPIPTLQVHIYILIHFGTR